MLEKICDRTGNQLFVLKGQKLFHEFVPRGWNELSVEQRRWRGCVALSINETHGFFYACPNARNGIHQKNLDFLPRFEKHAKLLPRTQEDDPRVPYSEMLNFNIEGVLVTISSGKSAVFAHPNLDSLVD